MTERAVKHELGRETRSLLSLALVVDCLWALQEGRDPAVPYLACSDIRTLGWRSSGVCGKHDSALCCDAPANSGGKNPPLIARGCVPRFSSTVAKEVWPKSVRWATPGVSPRAC